MDWVTVVFIIIFFVLPVIQQVLEAKRGRRGGADEGLDAEEEWESIQVGTPPQEQRPPRRVPADPRGARQTWSEGWGSWPVPIENEAPQSRPTGDASAGDRTPEEAFGRRSRESEERLQEAAAERRRPVPERPRAELALDVPEVRVRPLSTDLPRPQERAAAPSPRSAVRRPTTRSRTGPTAIAGGLRNNAQLRQAVLLREILGPPLALRSGEADRSDMG